MINFLLAYYYSLCSKMSKTSVKNVEEHIIVEEVVEVVEVEEQTEDETVKRSMKKGRGGGPHLQLGITLQGFHLVKQMVSTRQGATIVLIEFLLLILQRMGPHH